MSFPREHQDNRIPGHSSRVVSAGTDRLVSGRKYSPDQPRVPAGSSEGGQWTSGGGTTVSAPTRQYARNDRPSRGVAEDIGSTQAFAPEANVRTETRSPFSPGWTQRHIVELSGGRGAIYFENNGPVQTIVDAATGASIAKTRWTANGAKDLPVVRSVYANPLVVEKTLEAAAALYAALSTQFTKGQTPVAEFAIETATEAGGTGLKVRHVGTPETEEVQKSCPKLPDVQRMTDRAVAEVKRIDTYMTPSQFGTAVHMNLKDQINRLGQPNFRAERSFRKEVSEGEGLSGSVRIDAYELVQPEELVCVYDIKTGNSKLTFSRMEEIARTSLTRFGGNGMRMIILQIRPTGW